MSAKNRIDATARIKGKGRKASAERSGKLPRLYLCIMFANDGNAGKIIAFVVSWYPHAQRRRKGTDGVWSVLSRRDICEGAGLSLKQYERAMPVAVRCGAVDFIIGGHAGKKAIFTRPTGALMAYLRDATDRPTAHRLRPKGGDGWGDGGGDPIQPSHSLQSSKKKEESPVPGGKGRAEDRLPPGQPEHASPGPLVEPQPPPPGETAPCPAGPDDLLSRVRAAKAGGLNEAELRAELLRLLPPAPGERDHGIWHPSDKYPAWCDWSPAKLIEKQRLYERYVNNAYRANSAASRPATQPAMTDEEAIANGYELLSDEEMRRREEILNEMSNLTFEEWEDGVAAPALIGERT